MNTKNSQSSKSDWLDFALSVLVEQGPDALKIDPLCKLKGVSKGSFYHHFSNRADFIDQLMAYWFEKMTLDFIAQANTQASPLERLEKLDQVIAGNNIEAELHIRAWALKEPTIAQHLAKIDQQRQQYLSRCYIELGMNDELANDVAIMAYSSFLGLQQIYPKPDIATILRVSALGSKTFIEGIK
ncbi:TetR/AcrR family transcriptional regulator [Psychrobium sp. 1_MG-2023]|uniref:TetR/AcrR family transcriptional regulator n=1 Tax=Psychrobium sp. 1_MG-2023 TaxID=3062624 RepID=UPI000C31FF3B|nr:TetR/AcrR family transcriptional regulator [Psychrobium sp. 1_MG-2023]MDP2562797.1 TetR/AcrR family transcriptional regulator [Psychrobium sp. 1_MG-2023]PKF54454.1 TetR/AcrR family transcriptional regulator [Alteromonadales bacterium alter-6D02]